MIDIKTVVEPSVYLRMWTLLVFVRYADNTEKQVLILILTILSLNKLIPI